jgi:hypothetical protein
VDAAPVTVIPAQPRRQSEVCCLFMLIFYVEVYADKERVLVCLILVPGSSSQVVFIRFANFSFLHY